MRKIKNPYEDFFFPEMDENIFEYLNENNPDILK